MPSSNQQQLLRFCPRCGSKDFVLKKNHRHCQKCGLEYFFNAKAAALAIIFNSKGQLLLGVRAKEPAKGMLSFPGGFVEPDETLEQALAREVAEETNLRVETAAFFKSFPNKYEYSGVVWDVLDLYFFVKVKNFEKMKVDDESAELLFVDLKKIKSSDLAFYSTKKIFNELKKLSENDIMKLSSRDL
jgi:NAD+ diphosphatase